MKQEGARDKSRRRWWRRVFLVGALLGMYPAFVVGATYWQWFRADLPGGRNGPADAYRHSLASAIVAYTLSPRCVDWVSRANGQAMAKVRLTQDNTANMDALAAAATIDTTITNTIYIQMTPSANANSWTLQQGRTICIDMVPGQ